jgi:hypothetical protein
MKIIDKDGVWLVGNRIFPTICPFTSTRFEQNMPVRIKKNAWIEQRLAAQDILPWSDGTTEAAKPPPAPPAAPQAAK